jgi:hypothetical protein
LTTFFCADQTTRFFSLPSREKTSESPSIAHPPMTSAPLLTPNGGRSPTRYCTDHAKRGRSHNVHPLNTPLCVLTPTTSVANNLTNYLASFRHDYDVIFSPLFIPKFAVFNLQLMRLLYCDVSHMLTCRSSRPIWSN